MFPGLLSKPHQYCVRAYCCGNQTAGHYCRQDILCEPETGCFTSDSVLSLLVNIMSAEYSSCSLFESLSKLSALSVGLSVMWPRVCSHVCRLLFSWVLEALVTPNDNQWFLKSFCFLLPVCVGVYMCIYFIYACRMTDNLFLLLMSAFVCAPLLYGSSEGWKADKALDSIRLRNVSTWQREILAPSQC